MLLTASCGLLGGGDEQAPAGQKQVKVSVLPLLDTAPLHLAIERGYFSEEGLNVQTVNASSGQDGITKLVAGDVDIAYAGDISIIMAQSKGAASLKFVAEASSASPRTTALMVRNDGSIKTLNDLAGRKIAINAPNGVSDTMTKSLLKEHNVDFDGVQWTAMQFPQMGAALANRDVDAAYLTEPFVTQASKVTGAIPLADPASGATADFPLAGYATTEAWATQNTDATAAFLRALSKGSADANADRMLVERLVVSKPEYKIDVDTAALMTVPFFRSTPSATALQRVPDLLWQFGILPARMPIEPMLLNPGKK